MWCGVEWCSVVWCNVVYHGVVWYGVVWCGLAWNNVMVLWWRCGTVCACKRNLKQLVILSLFNHLQFSIWSQSTLSDCKLHSFTLSHSIPHTNKLSHSFSHSTFSFISVLSSCFCCKSQLLNANTFFLSLYFSLHATVNFSPHSLLRLCRFCLTH